MNAFDSTRRALRRGLAVLAVAALGACDIGPLGGPLATGAPSTGPQVDASQPVKVGLLVPGGTGNEAVISRDLVNAARLAVAERGGVELTVHETGGTAAGAQAAATEAVNGGAQILLGPLFAEAANAAGLVAGQAGVNVLAFSNNTAIAGGNVFVLGDTFGPRARRLVEFAARQGRDDIFVVAGQNVAEQTGQAAILAAIQGSGAANLAGTETYPFSEAGVTAVAPRVAAGVQANAADAVFLTADTAGALPLLADLLPRAGVRPPAQQLIGLTRWDIPADTLALPGLQGAWFAIPDPAATNAFRGRFEQAYGVAPHPLAGLAFDGIAAITELRGRPDAVTSRALTRATGFAGATGSFRLFPNGTNQRALAIAQIREGRVAVIDAAPRSFGGAGS